MSASDSSDEGPQRVSASAARRSVRESDGNIQRASRAARMRRREAAAASESRSESKSRQLDTASHADVDRLDPRIFALAAQTRSESNNDDNNDEMVNSSSSNSITSMAVQRVDEAHSESLASRSLSLDSGHTAITVQQIPSTSSSNANILDTSSALPSTKSSRFIRQRLYKRKPASPSKTAVKQPKPLLFDPLLDGQPSNSIKPKRSKTRMHVEQARRGRQSAAEAYAKSKPGLAGPLFASSNTAKTKSRNKSNGKIKSRSRARTG